MESSNNNILRKNEKNSDSIGILKHIAFFFVCDGYRISIHFSFFYLYY